jgi:hypothetical protein
MGGTDALTIVDNFDGNFTLEPNAKETLFELQRFSQS